jgi:hypothetical protein
VAADLASQIAGTTGAVHDVGVGQGPHRPQDIQLAVAQVALAEADRRLHRDQAEQL